MTTIKSGSVRKVGALPARVLRSGKQPSKLPLPAHLRHQHKLEKWREKIRQSRYQFLGLLDPQYRELMRKIAFRMTTAKLPGMVPKFLAGLFSTWLFTGSVQKMEAFILEVWKGRIFLMNDRRFLPQDLPTDRPKLELLQALLLYDPKGYPAGVEVATALEATHFFAFVGPSPRLKPWIREWATEMEDVRKQAAAELGEEMAHELGADPSAAHGLGHDDRQTGGTNQQVVKKVAYW